LSKPLLKAQSFKWQEDMVMPDTHDFIHLPFPLKKRGTARYPQSKVPGRRATTQNKQNRQTHRDSLRSQAQKLSRFWHDRRDARSNKNLTAIKGGVPFLLEIEPTTDVEFLRGLGFEVICDLEEGFIVVSTEQIDLEDFIQKIDAFVTSTHGSGNVAKVYALHADDDRIKRILSTELYNQWNTLDDATVYIIEVSVSCAGTASPPNLPDKLKNETNEQYNNRILEKINQYSQAVDAIIMERQTQIENIVNDYEGKFLSPFIEEGDTFSVTVRISGKGLRDIVLNYSYIFEVAFKSQVTTEIASENLQTIPESLIIIPPAQESPVVCVIDSGIQEDHRYLSQAIMQNDSICLIPGRTNIMDEVGLGGHGTRVAGAILYPYGIPAKGPYQLPCFIRNAKIMGSDNGMSDDISREGVIQDVVNRFYSATEIKSKIFNHSIGERKPFYELKHMSPWAAKIDEVSYGHDVLFIQAAGNMTADAIVAHIQAGYAYPDYLGQPLSQISNPAQSLQALTVGSVSHSDYETDDVVAIGKNGEPSSFTRVGPGIWDSIKPDVVEYGGTHAINKSGDNINLTTPEEVCPELIRRSPEGPAYSKDDIGTSFATPKVAYIAAAIQHILPSSPALLYRALIAQSARWPNAFTNTPGEANQNMLRRMGYGIPDIQRATHNTNYRATFVTKDVLEIGAVEAHIFTVNVPEQMRNLGENYNILLEITLSYAAKPKRTRRSYRSYLSTWLDWTCSRKNESRQDFEAKVFDAETDGQNDGQFPWMIHERQNWGIVKDFARPRQTLQKDWCVMHSSELSDEFCIAVRGHKGWGSLFRAKYTLTVSFEAIDHNIEIYEPLRVVNPVEVEVENSEIEIKIDDTLER
jgi:hypothetical protein